MITLILKIFAMWTVASIALGLLIGPFLKTDAEEPANHYPFPSGSILDVNHPERVS